ncbi:MAG: hypothetical protein JJ895_03660 [Balneolaceae bacterium]|nr:hypothetical protein [Balneolaceae bacterium]
MMRVLSLLIILSLFNSGCDLINILNNDSETTLLLSASYSDDEPYQLYIYDVESGAFDKLTNEKYGVRYFDWSKEANRIIYLTVDSENKKQYLKTINIDGSYPKTIHTDWANHKRISSIQWSPNGMEIVFTLGSIGTTFPFGDIYTLNIEEEKTSQITEDINTESFPFWDIDGSKIYYTSNNESGLNLYSVTIDGSNRTQLTQFNNSGYFRWFSKNKNLMLHGRLDTLTQSKRQWNSYLYDVKTGESNLLDLTPISVENNFRFSVITPIKDKSGVIVTKNHQWNDDHGTTLYLWNTETNALDKLLNASSIGHIQAIDID